MSELEAPDFVSPSPAEPRVRRTSKGGSPPPAKKGPRNETLMRLLVAIPLAALAITIIIVGGAVFAAAMLGFACVGMLEFFGMAERAQPFASVAFVVAAGLILAAYFGDQYEMMLAALAVIPLMFIAGALRRGRSGVTDSIAFTTLAVIWIAVPFAHAVLIRELPGHGEALLLDIVVATVVSDTAAYLGGRAIGRHRLAPALSPNKTLEGLACGFVGGTLGFWFAGLYQDWLPGLDALAMGAAIAVVAPLGDLFQSMIKRDLDVKDTSTIFGPHGGVLDRLDAVLFTVVAGYYLSVTFVY